VSNVWGPDVTAFVVGEAVGVWWHAPWFFGFTQRANRQARTGSGLQWVVGVETRQPGSSPIQVTTKLLYDLPQLVSVFFEVLPNLFFARWLRRWWLIPLIRRGSHSVTVGSDQWSRIWSRSSPKTERRWAAAPRGCEAIEASPESLIARSRWNWASPDGQSIVHAKTQVGQMTHLNVRGATGNRIPPNSIALVQRQRTRPHRSRQQVRQRRRPQRSRQQRVHETSDTIPVSAVNPAGGSAIGAACAVGTVPRMKPATMKANAARVMRALCVLWLPQLSSVRPPTISDTS